MPSHETEPRGVSLERLALARTDFLAVCRTVSAGLRSLNREAFNSGALAGDLVLEFPTRTGIKVARNDGTQEMATSMATDRREGLTYTIGIGERLFDQENPLLVNKMIATFALDQTVMMRLETEPEHTVHDEIEVNLDSIWRYSLLPFNLTLPEGSVA
jgi:hypothetical protein